MKHRYSLLATLLFFGAQNAHAAPENFIVEPTHTFVTYEVAHFSTSTNRGRFDKTEGRISIDRVTKTGNLDITIYPASVNTGVAAMDQHLQNADFFQTEKFPTVQFKSDQLQIGAKGKVRKVSGTLTMLGQTHPVTLLATRFNCYDNPMSKKQVCGGDFETTIDRSRWGMNYGVGFMGNTGKVKLIIQVEAVKE